MVIGSTSPFLGELSSKDRKGLPIPKTFQLFGETYLMKVSICDGILFNKFREISNKTQNLKPDVGEEGILGHSGVMSQK